MSDLHDLLERKARAFRPDDDGLDHLLRRADRRHRRRRVTSAAVALAVAGVGAFGAFTALRGPVETDRPSDGRSAYRAIWPHPDYEVAVEIQRRANAGDPAVQWEHQANEVIAKFALDALGWVNVWVDPLPPAEVAGNGPATRSIRGCPIEDVNSETDVLYCPDDKLKDGTVTIERLLQKDREGIWSVTKATVEGEPVEVEPAPVPPEGGDPGEEQMTVSSDDPGSADALPPVARLAVQFVESRIRGTEYAREVLAPAAAHAYEQHDGGLDLYAYLEGEDVRWVVDSTAPSDPEGAWHVTLSFHARGGEFGDGSTPIVEVISVGPSDAGPLRVLTAERTK